MEKQYRREDDEFVNGKWEDDHCVDDDEFMYIKDDEFVDGDE